MTTEGRDAAEDELLRLAVGGDTRAFAGLVHRYERLVRALLLRLCRNPAPVDDLAQETFIKAWRKLDQQQDTERFGAWLSSIAYREFLQWRRRDKRYAEVLGEFMPGNGLSPGPDQSGLDLDVVLAAVSPIERECLLLHLGVGLSHGELAAAMDLPLGTVKSHLARGCKRVQAQFAADQPKETGYGG